MRHGLGDAEKDQPYAYPSAEQHSQPRASAELRPILVLAQPDSAKAAESQKKQENYEQSGGDQVHPAKGLRYNGQGRRVKGFEAPRKEHAPNDE